MNILITICGRGGSKGIPGKNIRSINGKPLIAYSIDTAQRFAQKYKADIALSTDDDQIKQVAEAYNLGTTYTRPEVLSSDTAGKIDAIKDIVGFTERLERKKYDYVIDLDVTSPLRTPEDIEQAFEILRSNEPALNIFSVSPAKRNPYFNMVEAGPDGFFKTVKDGKQFKTRQSAPKVYDMNASFYIYKRRFFTENFTGAITPQSLVYVVPHLCFDLDEPEDFEIMAMLMERKLLGFTL